MIKQLLLILFIIIITLINCKIKKETFINKKHPMGLYSHRLYNNGQLFKRYRCDGKMSGDISDISPGFYWRNIPIGTASLALIMEDTTNKHNTVTHWIVSNIMSNSELEENDKSKIFALNDFNFQGYTGPCKEEYIKQFTVTLYALDILNLPNFNPKITKKTEFLNRIKPHILEKAKMVFYL